MIHFKNYKVMISVLVGIVLVGTIQSAEAVPGDLLLTINNPTPEQNDDSFGFVVASTPNGNIIVGDPEDNDGFSRTSSLGSGISGAGSVYLFDGNTGVLLLTINNPTPDVFDFFGGSVASTPNGNIIVGAPFDDNSGDADVGVAYLFDVSTCDNAVGSIPNDGVCEVPKLTINNPTPAGDDFFGESVASTPNGNIIVGATLDDTGFPDAGSAYLFDGNTGVLLLTINNPTLGSGDFFGIPVASTPNGNIIIGATFDDTGFPDAGSAYLFDVSTCDNAVGSIPNDGVCEVPKLTINNPTPAGDDVFGESVASTPNGNIIVGATLDDTGAINAGSAYLFDVSTCDNAVGSIPNDGVCEVPKLTINNPTPNAFDFFGESVASTPNGNIIVGADPAYLFEKQVFPQILTRDHFVDPFGPNPILTTGHTAIDYDTTGNIPGLESGQFPSELVVYIHGFRNSPQDALDEFEEAKKSLEFNNYPHPIIGYSWDSDISGLFFGQGDFIADEVDALPQTPSVSFDDIQIGGTTFGKISSKGGQTVFISESPNPDGVSVEVVESVGLLHATIVGCTHPNTPRSLYTFDTVDHAIITCTSSKIKVISGPIDAQFSIGGPVPATTTLSDGDTLTFDPNTLAFTAGPSTTAIINIGSSTITVLPGQTVTPNIIPPVITLLGSDPVSVVLDSTYIDAGATASDNVDGNVTSNIITGGLPVDTSILGPQTVTYDVSDSSGNNATQVTRTVNVVTAPTLPSNIEFIKVIGLVTASDTSELEDQKIGFRMGTTTERFTIHLVEEDREINGALTSVTDAGTSVIVQGVVDDVWQSMPGFAVGDAVECRVDLEVDPGKMECSNLNTGDTITSTNLDLIVQRGD